MKIIAKRSVQLNGHIYAKDEAAEYDGPVDDRIAALFTASDGTDLKPANGQNGGETKGGKGTDANRTLEERIEKLVKSLGKKGIMQKLDELGMLYTSKMSDSQLATLLLQQQGEI